MQSQRGNHELRQQLRELLREADRLATLIEQAEAPGRHAVDRPRLRLIRGGKALVLAPVAWAWTQVREHATAASGIAAAGVLAVPTTLGVGVAGPEVYPGAQDRSTMTTAVTVDDEQQELHRPYPAPSLPRSASSPVPLPTVTVETAEAVEPGGSPPDSPAPVSVPTLTPTPAPTLPPVEEVVDPVEEVVWTKAAALVECRDVLQVPPADLRECVRELLAS